MLVSPLAALVTAFTSLTAFSWTPPLRDFRLAAPPLLATSSIVPPRWVCTSVTMAETPSENGRLPAEALVLTLILPLDSAMMSPVASSSAPSSRLISEFSTATLTASDDR